MRKLLPLFLFLFVIISDSKADCNPAFTFTVQQATVQVQATNTAPHLFHSWRFAGYITFSMGPSGSFTFYAPGTYEVVHRVVDSLGNCEDSVLQTVVINYQITCNASFVAVRDSFMSNQYHFNSTSSAVGTTISSYSWALNGYPLSFSNSFSHSLPTGLNVICLTIHTNGGCVSSVCDTISVAPNDSCGWSASFTATASPSSPRQISFAPTPSLDRMRFSWNFGDGYSSTQKSPVHTYNHTGAYNVRLIIVDTLNGCNDSTLQQVQVNGSAADSCTVSFTYTANPSQSNQLSFTASSNQTITSQLWWIYRVSNPADSVVLTTNNPTYTFADTGYYMVCLHITTTTGCSKFTCQGIYITNVGGRLSGTLPSFPNPATSTVSFNVQLSQESKIGITVYNLAGNAVYAIQQQGVSGTNRISIPVQHLKPGQYFIDINYGTQRSRSLFQKM